MLITRAVPVLAFALAIPVAAADLGRSAMQRHHLQVEQQQDALNLNLRQSIGRRPDLAPEDARQLDQLQLQQRAQQQLLDQQQEQQLRRDIQVQRNDGALSAQIRDQRLNARRDAFAAERELQMQQFELQQRRLTDSAPRAPLQPPAGSPQLHLP